MDSSTVPFVLKTAFIILSIFRGAFGELVLTAKPSTDIVVGGRVVLHCVVNLVGKRSLNTNWMHNGSMIGENCDPFHKKPSHSAVCPKGKGKDATYYDYIIDPVAWEDRGPWSCYYGMNSSVYDLNVIVPQKMAKFAVKRHGDVNGEGTKTLPFDLTGGHSLSLGCVTRCGYPWSKVRWTFKNATLHGMLPPSSMNHDKGTCVGAESGMFVSSSKLNNINCSNLNLVGLNEISCSVDYTQANIGEFSKKIFFLCPGGKLAPMLTYGEIVAIAIGAAIALILFFLNWMLLRENLRKAARNRALA